MQRLNACVVHDSLLVRGGAEKLVDVLATDLSAPLIVGSASHIAPEMLSHQQGRVVVLGRYWPTKAAQYWVGARRFAQAAPGLLDRDAVVYSGILSILAANRQLRGRKIHYCHSPPRFFYDLKPYYATHGSFFLQWGMRWLEHWLKPRYEDAIRGMDTVIANSENVRQRLRHFLNVESIVVHPPIETTHYRWLGQGNYYVSLARLEPFKRVEVLVDAFLTMPDKTLVVASGGSDLGALKARANGAGNIRFTGWLSESAMAELIGNAIACLYIPMDEDFGMSPVESMAAGKPVIGVAEGGVLETVLDEETGLLIPDAPTANAVREAVFRMTPERALSMREACQQQAARFGREVFIAKMREQLQICSGSPV